MAEPGTGLTGASDVSVARPAVGRPVCRSCGSRDIDLGEARSFEAPKPRFGASYFQAFLMKVLAESREEAAFRLRSAGSGARHEARRLMNANGEYNSCRCVLCNRNCCGNNWCDCLHSLFFLLF